MILSLLILSILLTVSKRSFYEILGVSKDATDREIKKAYRKAALKWHPDKHPQEKREKASKRFTRISNAYEVLIDEEKRKIYDVSGEEGLKHRSGGGGSGFPGFGNPQDTFRDFFGKSGFGGGRRTSFNFGGGGGGGGFPGGGGRSRGGGGRGRRQGPSYTKKGPVKKLSPRKFPDDKAKFNWVVHFWGGEQQDNELKPAMDEAAKWLKEIVKIGFVDCIKYNVFCNDKGISDGSAVYLYNGKRRLTYGGGPHAKKIRNFAVRAMSHNLQTLKEAHFDEESLKAIENGIIIFSNKRKPGPKLKALSFEFRHHKLSILFIKSKMQCLVKELSFETLPAAFIVEHGQGRPIKGEVKPKNLKKTLTLLSKKKRTSSFFSR